MNYNTRSTHLEKRREILSFTAFATTTTAVDITATLRRFRFRFRTWMRDKYMANATSEYNVHSCGW